MKTILLLNPKGGVGKSFFADELAFAFERCGVRTSFFDLNNQGGTIHETIEVENAEVQIVDTPGELQKNTAKWIEAADIVVIPTLTTNYDSKPFERIILVMDQYDKPTIIIVNGYNGYNEAKNFLDQVQDFVGNRTVTTCPRLDDFVKAHNRGMSVVDYRPKSKASEIIISIANEVKKAAGFETEEYDANRLSVRARWLRVKARRLEKSNNNERK